MNNIVVYLYVLRVWKYTKVRKVLWYDTVPS